MVATPEAHYHVIFIDMQHGPPSCFPYILGKLAVIMSSRFPKNQFLIEVYYRSTYKLSIAEYVTRCSPGLQPGGTYLLSVQQR